MTRPATKSDCTGCREAWRNNTVKPCWSLATARIVPMWRFKGRGDMEPVEMPSCLSHAGWMHSPRIVLPESTT